MDYEQKYKKALERARAINDGKDVSVEAGTTTCEYIFPELKESEDDKIRKAIIAYFKRNPYVNIDDDACIGTREALAWLEKQDEQKSIDYNEELKKCQENPLYFFDKYISVKLKNQQPYKSAIEAWRDMRLEVYQQASGNRHEPNYSDNTTKMFSLNDIDEIIEKISEQKSIDNV